MQAQQKKLLNKLLMRGASASRLGLAWTALCVGTTLLLVAVLLWWNFRQVLHGNVSDDSLGSTFLTISKTVTDETMARPGATGFTQQEIEAIKKAPQVQDAGVLTPAAFKVTAMLGGQLNFYTYLFLESADDRFMDRRPDAWDWQPGNRRVPIILSKDFLNMYNYVFAPGQGMPQLSENSIKALGFTLLLGEEEERYTAEIVGFSDRISSVLVPQNFMADANQRLANGRSLAPSRLILKVGDASDDAFIAYLKNHNYGTNTEQLRWNKMRGIVSGVAGATGILAILLMGISILVFVLFIELTIARAGEAVKLLLQLGYAPKALGSFLYSRFLPVIIAAIGLAALLAAGAQTALALAGRSFELSLPYMPGWPVWAVLAVCMLLLLALLQKAVGNAIKRI